MSSLSPFQLLFLALAAFAGSGCFRSGEMDPSATDAAPPDARVDEGDGVRIRDASLDAGPDEETDAAIEHSSGVVALGIHGAVFQSCDEGQTWSTSEANVCDDACASDEAPYGLVFDGNSWLAAIGEPDGSGEVRRSRNAVEWETVFRTSDFGALALVPPGPILVGRERVHRSLDGGATWFSEPVPFRTAHPNVGVWEGASALVNSSGWLVARFGGLRTVAYISTDDGQSWRGPAHSRHSFPVGCRGFGMATANGRVLLAGADTLCVSNDDGRTYALEASPTGGIETVLNVNGEFWGYGGGYLHRSRDARTWQSHALQPHGHVFAAVQLASGAFVASNGRGGTGHALLHSQDGLHWFEADGVAVDETVRFLAGGQLPSCAD